ncbi:carbohydrate ABC transporter permease [Lederbergia sp. NSJ-179]|uniref:carbohydrate ABC transporter permease n=1 Tax=Lederbergia sp. NSJ-179 TaxID=2931402 RepID=UPI001FD2844C|nr:carbohydrate ABC transporter permease [Lederbergia sp. NSJ-179]MCJ7840697.1 carbohydrate ABC transporter permease [Lederbergia sp. NSJ-179]
MFRKIKISNILSYIVLILMSIFVLFPFLWTFLTSIKSDKEMFSIPPFWIPESPNIQNYVEVLGKGDFQHFIINSIVISFVTLVLALLIGAPAAYGFARYKFKLSGFLFALVVAVRMFPPITLVIPYFIAIRSLGLIDTKVGLMITYLPLMLTLIIWILESFFREVPIDIEEAAEMDGLGTIGKFVRIVLPLSLPAIGVASILGFMVAWNEFMLALTLTQTVEAQTMPVGIAGYVTTFQTYWGQMSANGMMYIIPVIVFTFIAQKGLVKGLTAGAVK